MMKKDGSTDNINIDQKLQQIENNQKKLIAQNDKIINLLERINSSITGIHHERLG
jgi:hypothetical protein